MKILHIHPSLECGGIEAMICSLANQMVNNHDVYVCTIFRPTDDDVFLHKLDKRISVYSLNKIHSGFSVLEIWKIYRFICKYDFDVVHLHGFFYYYFLSVLFLHSRIKFIYTVHSDAKMENSRWDNRLYFLKKTFFRKKYLIPVTISDVSRASFESYYGTTPFLIYNGIPMPSSYNGTDPLIDYRYTPNTKIFLHLGRITKAKNQVVLCRVFDRLIKSGEDVVLLIAGSKQDMKIFSEIVPFLSVRIIYIGERKDVNALLKYSDAMCLSSIWEGLPMTLLEALSVGCIPICTPVGGIPDVLQSDVNGLLSEDTSEESYYNVIRYFLGLSKERIQLLSNNATQSFEKYDIATTAEEYIKLYAS